MVRLGPVLGLVILMVAPFPWGALAAPAEPQKEAPPVASALAPPVASSDPPREMVPAVELYWYATAPLPVSGATFDMLQPRTGLAPGFVRVVYLADQMTLPLASVASMRTGGALPQPTWSQASIGPVPGHGPAVITFTVAANTPGPTPAGAPAPQVAAPAVSVPGPAAGPPGGIPTGATPMNVPAGGVSELFARIPPDLGARPYRLLRLLGRGLSLFPFLVFRIRERDGLDQETRRLIYAYLREHPGALAGQIADELGLRRQTILYHLRVLMQEGLVISHANGRRHYFRRDDPQRVDTRNVLSPGTRTVLDMLPDDPVTAQELAERIGLTRRTVQWHLGRLREHGLVRGARSRHGTRYVRAPGTRRHFRSV